MGNRRRMWEDKDGKTARLQTAEDFVDLCKEFGFCFEIDEKFQMRHERDVFIVLRRRLNCWRRDCKRIE